MSIYKSYFKRNDTLIYNSYTNTGRNPVVELFFGRVDNLISPKGYSRFIFDLNLDKLESKISNGTIATGCSSNMTHVLKMTNTSSFDEELLNTTWSNGRRRATSFDLVLFRIPKVSGTTGDQQSWDEGVGYDYYGSNSMNSSTASSYQTQIESDKSFSDRPSNWHQRSTIKNWSLPGIYDNTNSNVISGLNYSGLTIVSTQHFEFGDEDIEFDMSNEINSILTGGTVNEAGWGIAFVPQVENITGMTENYSVGFFSRHTQTFYEPYLETTYNDLIQDDRYTFYQGKTNKLYLYAYINGNPINLDENPVVDIIDSAGNVITTLTACARDKGVYEISVPPITGATTVPCMYYDNWRGLVYNGDSISPIENEFVLLKAQDYFTLSTRTEEPKIYGFDFSGIKQDEKILNTDIRKVNLTIKKAYTSKEVLSHVESYYRIYVKEGTTEVQVQDWTQVNKTSDGYYFVFDTTDKIPNEYFVDMKVVTDREINTYKRELQFQIVNKK
tara:strand:+ start:8459 stop:9958 length:1500 start_codon:yes stop_codon:yes gene_type:complete